MANYFFPQVLFHPLIFRHFLFVFIAVVPSSLSAQNGSLTGRVLDADSESAMEYATISIYHTSDSSLITGTITDEGGIFTVDQLPVTPIYYVVQFIGYQSFSSDVLTVDTEVNLGDIILKINSGDLDEVVVTSKALTAAYKLDKQVYDTKQFKNAVGGNASDVLKNLPSVSVDAVGEISVRGANGFQVMINGRPVQGDPRTILSQISANSIHDIEIVTAPSAKYDPDGNAGIINIKTSKALEDGNYLVANVLMGLPSIESYDNQNNAPRYGADITYNTKKGKWDFSGALDYRRYDISGRRVGYVNTYIDEILTEFPSFGERSFDEINYSARGAVNFSPSNNETWSLGIYAGKRTKDRTADILYQNQQRVLIPQDQFLGTEVYYDLYRQKGDVYDGGTRLNSLTFFNENLRIRKSDFLIASFDYAHTFRDQSRLKISSLYERTILGGPTDNANLRYPNISEVYQLQVNDNVNPLDGVRAQIDYSRKIGENSWESGYQFRHLSHPGDFEYFDRDLQNQVWVENPQFTNAIDLTRSIHSVYSQISGMVDHFHYTGGLRLEHFDRKVGIERPEEVYSLSSLNLFPSILFGFDLTESSKIKAGYSKRIERTTTFKMTPFPEREHSETLEQGDAELLPEYIDLMELGYVKYWGDNSFFTTVYYRNVQNVINRVNTVFNDTILNRIYTNVGRAQAIGVELGATVYPIDKWQAYIGGNIYNYQIEGHLFDEEINTSNSVYSINANTNYSFSPTFSMQLSFNYLSERVTAQGRDSEFYNPSLNVRKSFWDNRLVATLQWQNIDLGLWNANEQRITTYRAPFFTTTNYIYEVDIVQLNITYHLNQVSKKVKLPESEFGDKEFD